MQTLFRRVLPYVVAVVVTAGLWLLIDVCLSSALGDSYPTNWPVRALVTLAAFVLLILAIGAVVAVLSLFMIRAHRQDDAIESVVPASLEKMALEGRLDYRWLCKEKATRESIKLLHRVRP